MTNNRIILGLMTFGPDTNDESRITTQAGLIQALDSLEARGYKELDTARVYIGHGQEAWTRQAGWKERGFALATKIQYPYNHGDNAGDKVKESMKTSLAELGTNSVDVLYLHAPDRGTPFADTLSAINDLHTTGAFRIFGLSNFTAFEVAEIVTTCAARGWVRPTLFQAMYNALTRGIESELIPACRRYGLDLVVYNPLCAGLLAGKIRSADAIPTEGRFGAGTGIGMRYRDRYFRPGVFEALGVVERAAEATGLTMVEVALRWMMHHSALKVRAKGGNDGVIIGVSSHAQLVGNIDDLEKGPLPDDVVEALEKAWLMAKADAPDYWHLGKPEYSYDTIKAVFGKGIE